MEVGGDILLPAAATTAPRRATSVQGIARQICHGTAFARRRPQWMAVPWEVALKIWHARGGERGGGGARVWEGKGKKEN